MKENTLDNIIGQTSKLAYLVDDFNKNTWN